MESKFINQNQIIDKFGKARKKNCEIGKLKRVTIGNITLENITEKNCKYTIYT